MVHGEVAIGAVLAGRYRVERVLGQGGMGIVIQAMHLQLQQPVAMKFLLHEVLGDQQVVQRFLQEAQAVVRLRSEHVARVFDVGTLETGAPYMVFEYLEGADLSSFPRSQLTVGGIVDLMLQACEALAEAHSLGIVHRDIKPANFFITRRADGSLLLKVLDFGISKVSTKSQLTAAQTVLGTAAYMSPEQMRSSRDVDHRSDIWSLGIVLYELFQGTPPFDGDSFSSTVLRVANEPLPRLTVRLPAGLDDIIYRCLEKDPARRFQNTAELADTLAKYAQSEAQAVVSVQRTRGIVGMDSPRAAFAPGQGQRSLPSTISGAAGARTTPRPGSRSWRFAGFVGALLIGGAIVLVLARGGGDASSRATPAAVTGEPHAAPTHVEATASDATPPIPARPAATVSNAGAAGTVPLDAGVGDRIDATSASGSNSAAVPPPLHQQNTSGDGPHPATTREPHANPSQPAAPTKTERRKLAPPKFDRGD